VTEHFAKIGLIPDRVFLPKERETDKPRGFAFVDLPTNEQYVVRLKFIFLTFLNFSWLKM